MFNKIARLLILWAIGLSFFALIIIACWEIRDITLAYLFASISALVGLVLIISFMIGYAQQEAVQGAKLSKLYSDLISSLRGNESGLWSPSTLKVFETFQDYFKRIYPLTNNVEIWPQKGTRSTLADAQNNAREHRKLRH